MSGRFINPLPQFMDSTPDLYSGGKLYFYASGTSTPLSTYTTKALSVANSNPVILNSAGRPPNDIFLQDLEYKVVLKDSNDVTIWSADPVSHRDSGLVVKTVTGSGSPNGVVAGTAGSASILPDFYWDYTNSILYVCTTTGTISTAVWTAINASAATPAVPPPQGRLTPTSAAPIITTGVTSGTAVYYTPYVGNLIPIYNGSTMTPTEFAELTLTLSASHALSTIYDVFVFSNSGVLTIVTGPAWTTSTAGSGARGTGASTTQLTRIKGLWVNAVQMTARNGATTYTVGANLATYVGSICIDGTAGQITCHTAWGQSRKWGVWNAYNRVSIILQGGDSTASWSYAVNSFRALNGEPNNSLTVFMGLAEEAHRVNFKIKSTAGGAYKIGIGVNSTTVPTGYSSFFGALAGTNHAEYVGVPILGLNKYTGLELSSGSTTVEGTQDNCLLVTEWRG